MKALSYYITKYGFNQTITLLNLSVQTEDQQTYKQFFLDCLNRMPSFTEKEIIELDPGYIKLI